MQMQCEKCLCFFTDWLNKDLETANLLHAHINKKRLSRVIHYIIPIIYRIFYKMNEDTIDTIYYLIHLENSGFNLEINDDGVKIKEIGLNETWFETSKICKMYAREDIQTIETIMEDAYVCKKEYISQWIGYCLFNLLAYGTEIHIDHSGGFKIKEDVISSRISLREEEEAVSPQVSITIHDELYD